MTDNGKILSFSQLPAFIEMVEGMVKEIPQDQIVALRVIHLMLEVINTQQVWVTGLKTELVKLDNLNKSQAEMITNLKKIEIV